MHKIFLILSMTLPLISKANTINHPLNCLQWHFSAEKKYVTKPRALDTAGFILESGSDFGFIVDGKSSQTESYNFYYKYNRDLILDNQAMEEKYYDHIKNLFWHLNSPIGFQFECSFEAPEPHPRITGSN